MNVTSNLVPESGVSINAGGRVFKIGHLALINTEITTTASIAAWHKFMSGLPIRSPASSVYFVILDTANANKIYRGYIDSDGTMHTRDSLPAGVYNIDLVYTTA